MFLRPVNLQHANFPHRFAMCRSKLEGPSLRWVPYGMPRLGQHFQNVVFFLCGLDPKTGKVSEPIGSGVIVGMRDMVPPATTHMYAVTSAHVVNGGGSIIRLNTTLGGSRPIHLDPSEWTTLKGIEDLAAIDISDRLEFRRGIKAGDDISYWPTDDLLLEAHVEHYQLGVGEDGFMLGLFTAHSGKTRNLVAARFGNISLLANDEAPIRQDETGIESACHVFDIHSRPGFSGSPVFVYRTPSGDLRNLGTLMMRKSYLQPPIRGNLQQASMQQFRAWQQEMTDLEGNAFIKLLGIHVGQFREPLKIWKKKRKTKRESDDIVREGDLVYQPSSMTIVAPAWQIARLLEEPALKKQREAFKAKARAKIDDAGGYVASESEVATPPEPEGSNPSHREDFKSLLGAASTKNKPAR